LWIDDLGGRFVKFSAEQKRGFHTQYFFDLFLTSRPCPHHIPDEIIPDYQAAITLGSDIRLQSWELNLYRLRSFSKNSKILKDSLTIIEPDIKNHISSLIRRVVIFTNTLVFWKSKVCSIDENTSLKFSNVKRIVYEHGGDSQRANVVKFLVEQLQWTKINKTTPFATSKSAMYELPNLQI
jgi:hypothetical protein